MAMQSFPIETEYWKRRQIKAEGLFDQDEMTAVCKAALTLATDGHVY